MSNNDDIEDAPDVADTQVPENPDENDFSPNRFNISSYGWDSDVEGLVKRLKRGDIYVPGFQRRFVWNNTDKSRFIESLIIGLPVPNIFLAQDAKKKNLNIVDGQQRLLTLRDYLDGKFFLSGKNIQDDLRGRYFSADVAKASSSNVLTEADARSLSDAVIHSIVIKPDPADDDAGRGHEYNQAIIQIFRRLNTSGRPLQAQEIRASIFYGPLDTLLRTLNQDENWRALFGPEHSRLRDMELILRAIALSDENSEYRSPMPRFLDGFMERNREISDEVATSLESEFQSLFQAVRETVGPQKLRRGTTFFVSKFDAIIAGYRTYLKKHGKLDNQRLLEFYEVLDNDEEFKESIEQFVNDTDRVKKRIKRARDIFGA